MATETNDPATEETPMNTATTPEQPAETLGRPFTFVLYSRGPNTFGVHKAGCRDLTNRRPGISVANAWDARAATVEEAIAAEVEAFQSDAQEYDAADFEVFPCCR